MIEQEIELKTAEGVLDTFIVRPDEGGPHPAIIIYMDAPGIRQELRDMASRLATAGYVVALPNLYYRIGTEGNYGYALDQIRTDDAQLKRMHDCRMSLSNAGVVADTSHLLKALAAHPGVAPGPIGCVGYCMSGSFVVAVAAEFGKQIAAIASFYGVGIITDAPDSPHLRAGEVSAQTYLAFASDDPWVPATVLEELPGIIEKTAWPARIEIYPDTGHGFAFPQRTEFNRTAGERHWERIFSLMKKNLVGS